MSLQIQLKKSAVSQKQPFASDLAVGELALNYNADGPFLTCKDTAGNVRKLNNVWVAATAPSNPTVGDLWLDTNLATAVLKVYQDSTSGWVNATTIPVATTSIFGTVRLATSADITNGTSGKVVDAAQLNSKIVSAFSQEEITLNDVNLLGDLVVGGNLTVSGTTTTISSETLLVEDKNIEMGVVTTPTDSTADGGGLTLKGTTDKTLNWSNATDSWTSSENLDLASGKSYRINGTEVLSATALGSAVQISSANIPSGTIVDSDINASAEIAVSKLADGAARQLLQTDAAGTGVEWTSNVDVPGTLDVTGATTLDSTLGVTGVISANGKVSFPLGSAAAPSLYPGLDTDTGIYSPGANELAISTNGTGALFIDANGNVGVGVSSPAVPLHIEKADGSLLIKNTSNALSAVYLKNNSGIAQAFIGLGGTTYGGFGGNSALNIVNEFSSPITFYTSNTERMRLDSSGRLGLGTSSPGSETPEDNSGNALTGAILDINGHILFASDAPYIKPNTKALNGRPLFIQAGDTRQTNYAGGSLYLEAGGQDPSWGGLANGGNVFIDGGQKGGAGTDGNVILASNRGRVGIGTQTPSSALHVNAGSSNIPVVVQSTTSQAFINFQNSNNALGYIGYDSQNFTFIADNTERARIDSSGRLLVGTSSSVGVPAFLGNYVSPQEAPLQIAGITVTTSSSSIRNYQDRNDSTATIALSKSRSGTVGAFGANALPDNCQIGAIVFSGDDGDDKFVASAAIIGEVDGTPGSNDMPGRLVFSTTADGSASPTERMRITNAGQIQIAGSGTAAAPAVVVGGDVNTGLYSPGADQLALSTGGTGRLFVDASGNVGVGVSSPANSLHVLGTIRATTDFQLRDTDNNRILIIEDASNDARISNEVNGGDIIFRTNAGSTAERLRITSDGKLGLGTSNPSNALEVRAASAVCGIVSTTSTNSVYGTYNNGGGNTIVGRDRSTGGLLAVGSSSYAGVVCVDSSHPLHFATGNTVRATIDASGNVGIGVTGPQEKLHIDGNIRLPWNLSSISGYNSADYNQTINFRGDDRELRISSIGANNNPSISFYTGSNPGFERARIDSSGRLLVGTSSASVSATQILQGNSANSAGNGTLILARGTTSPASGNGLGVIGFTDSSHAISASIYAARDGGTWVSGSSQPSLLVFSTTADGSASPTERMRIDSSGRVGIGTTSPNAILHLQSANESTRGTLRLSDGIGRSLLFESPSLGAATANIKVDGSSLPLAFHVNGSERLRIDNSGRLLVGTSTAGSSLTKTIELHSAGTSINQPAYQTYAYPGTSADNAGYFEFYRSRGSTIGGNTIVAANDTLGYLRWYGANGTGYNTAAQISAQIDGTPGADDMPGRLVFSTTADGASSPTERMRIDSSGRVGIGTQSPGFLFQVNTDNATAYTPTSTSIPVPVNTVGYLANIDLTTNNTGCFLAISAANTTAGSIWYTGVDSGTSVLGGSYVIGNRTGTTAYTERVRIDSSGRLLVGTSTNRTGSNLQLEGTTGAAAGASFIRNEIGNSGGTIRLGKSRGTTNGSFAVVANNDALGTIIFSGADGTADVNGAFIQAYVDGTPGANDMPGRLVFSTTADGSASPAERMRIDSAGRVLIGTTSTTSAAKANSLTVNEQLLISQTFGVYAGNIGSTITATTGTVVFTFTCGQINARSAMITLSIACRTNNSTPSNLPCAEYQFQLHKTIGGVSTLNGAATIYEYTFNRSTDFAFADLGSGVCTVTLTNPTALAQSGTYKVEVLSSGGNLNDWTLTSVTTT